MRRKIPLYLRDLSTKFRKNQTKAEQIIWREIRNKQLGGFRFLRQYVIGRYIADYYCNAGKVAVEIDGKIHENRERREYDLIREEVIRMHGIKIVRFTNEEVMNDINGVLGRLLEVLMNNYNIG